MFDTTSTTIDELEQVIATCETEIARIRAFQADAIRRLDGAGVAGMDGCRSLHEWVRSRLDVASHTARDIVTLARTSANDAVAGDASFDRIVATVKLAAAGADQATLAASAGYDLAGVQRLTARHRRHTRLDERRIHDSRYVNFQPTLDDQAMRIHGLLPGYEARLFEKALHQRADELPRAPDDMSQSRGQRMADALVSIAQDSLDGPGDGTGGDHVTIFVDADLATGSSGERGATTDLGQPLGPSILEKILCDGTIELTGLTETGEPIKVTDSVRTIPNRLRRAILYRDQGCVIDGCNSRYRLQPHHRTPWAQGGTHDPDGLDTLCWFHHHVVIHRSGYTIDPGSPRQRRRLIRPARTGTDPP